MARIVIAEDEPDIRNLVEFTLKYGGHEVYAANNGTEALEMVSEQMPDLVLLDVRMPKLSGYEVCRIIKEDPKTKDIPVVFLSAKGQEAEVDEGIESGAIAYILKPFAPDQLLNRLKELMAQIEGEREKAAAEAGPEKPQESGEADKADEAEEPEEANTIKATSSTEKASPPEKKDASKSTDARDDVATSPGDG